MKVKLRPVMRFARQHQRAQWSVSDFVRALPARLYITPVHNSRVAGISIRDKDGATIGIDQRIEGSALYVPVLAHEVSHLLLSRDDGQWLCSPFGTSGRASQSWASTTERLAWYGASLLTISPQHMKAHRDGKMAAQDIAAECMAPVQFVNLRWTVDEAIRTGLPVDEHAVAVAYDIWQSYITQSLRAQTLR